MFEEEKGGERRLPFCTFFERQNVPGWNAACLSVQPASLEPSPKHSSCVFSQLRLKEKEIGLECRHKNETQSKDQHRDEISSSRVE